MKQFSNKLFSKKIKKVNKLMNKIFLSLLVLTMVTVGMSGVNTSFADTTTIGGSDITINSDTTLTGTSTGGNVTVTGGTSDNPIELTLDGVTIDLSGTGNINAFISGKPAIKIAANAHVKIILKSGTTNILKGGHYCAGLQQEGNSLEITGNGALTASSGVRAAGIGGGYNADGSNITISGGTVTATAGNYGGAGIGGGIYGDGSNITISGGTVTATAGSYGGAGIGGGSDGAGSNITISGGTVTATGKNRGSGIGDGSQSVVIGGSASEVDGDSKFETTPNGCAIIYTNPRIPSDTSNFSGIIFKDNENTGTMYGNPTINKDVKLKSGKSFTIPNGKTLTIANGTIFTNNGTVTNYGTLTNNGIMTGSGVVNGTGQVMYGIRYHRNHGINDTTVVTDTKGNEVDYTVKKASHTDINFTRTSYSFEKWTTNQDGTGTEYCTGTSHTENTSYTVDDSLDLYAKWKPNEYTISFDKNGGVGNTTPSAITADYDSSITLPAGGGLSKTGYHFTGWNTSSDGTGTNYSASGNYTINHDSDKTLYAQWTINQHTISFDKNGAIGNTTPSAITADYNSNITLPAGGGLSKTGYSFSGWNTKANGTGSNYLASGTYTINHDSDKTLFAKWTPIKYTISFNKNGAIGNTTPSAITADYNSNITLPDGSGLSKTGYSFSGWNTMADGTGTNYPASGTYTINHASDKTLYANWSNKPTFTLTYTTTTGGQITSGAAIQSVIQGTSGTQVMVVADSGYEFSGWSDGRQDNPRTDTNVQGDITVEATFRYIQTDNRRHRRRERTTSIFGQVENNTQNNNSKTEIIKLIPREQRKITLELIEYYQQREQELKQIYPDNLVVNGRVFTDVEEDSWYAESVKDVVQNNRMVGTSESTFSPEEEITMGMVSTMLYSMIELEPNEKDSTQPKEWYQDSMNWAEKIGILPSNNGKGGKAGRLIDAKEVISREQLIVTLYNFAKKAGYNTEVDYELTKYIDAFEISKDALPAMKWAVQNGLIAGTSKNTLSPQWTVDRAQLSVIFMNFDNMIYGDM